MCRSCEYLGERAATCHPDEFLPINIEKTVTLAAHFIPRYLLVYPTSISDYYTTCLSR
jgi:hypothetical protein